jgi:PEP-CTERM motif
MLPPPYSYSRRQGIGHTFVSSHPIFLTETAMSAPTSIRSAKPLSFFKSMAGGSALVVGLALGVAAPRPAHALTMMLNFASASSTDIFNSTVVNETFASWGFTGMSITDIRNATLTAVRNDYLGFPTIGTNASSPLPVGKELNINFEWTTGLTSPTNGDSQFYYVNIGDSNPNEFSLGGACYGCVRSNGAFSMEPNASMVGSIFTDSIAGLLGLATTNAQRINLLAGTISHEIGHTLLLDHPNAALANPGASIFSIMATGAAPTSMPNNQRILDRAFAYSEFSTLITTVGLRDVTPVPEPTTYLMMALGLAAVLVRARAKQVA